jgi:MoaA/NifB/PqqE/SkfB family radical SAM enzyme
MPEIPTEKIEFLKEGAKYLVNLPLRKLSLITGIAYSKPMSATIILTSRCNLNCSFCFIKKGEFKEKMNEEELMDVITKLAKWGVKQISFTGGEPLVEKELLYRMLQHSKNNGMIVGFVTNGTLFTEEDLDKIKNIGVDRISISIDGPKEIQEKLRGKDTYRKIMFTLEKLNQIKKIYGKPNVRINTTVFDTNIKYLEWLFHIAKKHGAQLVLSPLGLDYLTAVKKRKLPENVIKKLWVNKSNLPELKKQIERLKELKKKFGIVLNSDSFLDLIVDYYNNPKNIKRKCEVATYHLGITREGDVVICGYLGILGNVKKSSLKKIWNSNKFVLARKKMKDCNRCLIPCQYTPSSYDLMNDFIFRPIKRKIIGL